MKLDQLFPAIDAKRRAKGFTLVEVLVAMTILAVGVLALIQMFPHAMRLSRRAAERTTVSSLAKTELGRVKAGGVGDLTGPNNWAVRNAFKNLTAAQQAYGLYKSWRTSVQRTGVGPGGEVDLFRVTFAVELSDGREEKFVTYVTRQ